MITADFKNTKLLDSILNTFVSLILQQESLITITHSITGHGLVARQLVKVDIPYQQR